MVTTLGELLETYQKGTEAVVQLLDALSDERKNEIINQLDQAIQEIKTLASSDLSESEYLQKALAVLNQEIDLSADVA